MYPTFGTFIYVGTHGNFNETYRAYCIGKISSVSVTHTEGSKSQTKANQRNKTTVGVGEWWFNAVSATEAIFAARTCECFKQSCTSSS